MFEIVEHVLLFGVIRTSLMSASHSNEFVLDPVVGLGVYDISPW